MTVTIVRPGLLATVQDTGRHGYQSYGVPVGGAMDVVSLRIANWLAGNEDGAAALELTLSGACLRFDEDALIAVCGADLSPTADGRPLPQRRPVWLRRGSVVEFKARASGCRAYVAVAGGFDVPPVMGSRSTYVRGGIGGFEGRRLQPGDRLRSGTPGRAASALSAVLAKAREDGGAFAAVPWHVSPLVFAPLARRQGIRIIRGAEFGRFDAASREALLRDPFVVRPQSDRMGYRLSGPALKLSEPFELLSEGVSAGTIQVPPDGQPIVLMADRQTVGGYPRIAHVATVDLTALAQTMPGEAVAFRDIGQAEAERLLIWRELGLSELKAAIRLKLSNL